MEFIKFNNWTNLKIIDTMSFGIIHFFREVHMKKRFLSTLLCVSMVAAMAVGCGSKEEKKDTQSTEAENTEKKDTFVYAVTDDIGNTLNYFMADDRTSMTLAKMLSQPLFTINADGSYNYYAAESFEPSEDGLVYTCKLKADAKWSDGKVLTADDVVFTYETYMNMDESGMLAVDGKNIEVAKVDDTTVEFKLPSIVASMPENVASVTMIPKHVFEGKDSLDMNLNEDTIVGCGPYMFEEYKSGEYIKCVKNPNYVNGEANIENLVFQIITNDETAKAALQNREVDAWIALPSQLDGLEDFTITPYSEGRVAYTRLNRVSENMQDADYRKGIFKALNREDIMVAAYSSLDYATISYSFLPATNKFYTEDLEKYEQDVEEAKKLVEGGAKKLKICYIGDDTAQTAQAQVIQAELKEIGIELELCGLDQAGYMDSAYDNEDTTYDMYLGGYIMTIDPDGFKGMFGTGQMINYASDEIDNLFAKGMVETDEAARKDIYVKAQQAVADEALFYPFGTNLRILVTNPDVQGIEEAGLTPIFTFEDMSKLSFK